MDIINLPNLAKVIVGGDFNKDTLGYCNITMSRARRVIVNANNMAIILTLLGKSIKTKKNILVPGLLGSKCPARLSYYQLVMSPFLCHATVTKPSAQTTSPFF